MTRKIHNCIYFEFFRDGVGEGQLEEVRESEIKAIKNALGDMDIKLTFIVVSKRINTRFFQKDPASNRYIHVVCINKIHKFHENTTQHGF